MPDLRAGNEVIKIQVLWAQALDNVSPDHIELEGEVLSPGDMDRRQEAVSLVSRVIKNGSRIFDRHGVQLTVDERSFVVEVPSAEHDRAGRTAPIVCYGNRDSTYSDALGTTVGDELQGFARRIGRNILPEHLGITRMAFVSLQRKSSTRRNWLAAMVVALGLVSLVSWLVSTALNRN